MARVRPAVLVSYAAFVLVGVNSGVAGVLLPSQMASYGVDRTAIGITFFTIAAGFALAGFSTGALIHRFGVRITLTAGGGAYMLAGLYLASRPPFAAFVLAQVVTGFGTGVLESGLNVYLAGLPGATTLLNRLHAFFGVGALLGPTLAARILGFASWTVVWLVLAGACVPLLAGFLLAHPGPESGPEPAAPERGAAEDSAAAPAGLLAGVLRDRGVQLGAAMLAVYVGLEISVGNWGFSYLVQTRGLPGSVAGYAVSGYWLGLTLGRFLISPIAARIGVTTSGMMYGCLAGIAAAATLAWLSPSAALSCVALGLLGFFLGPVFPTTMAITPRLTRDRLVPNAIGVINAAAVGGGSALPWLAGAIAQSAGMRVLLPFALVLAVLQFAVWRPIAARLRAGRRLDIDSSEKAARKKAMYRLEAVIAAEQTLIKLTSAIKEARLAYVGQDLALLPMTSTLTKALTTPDLALRTDGSWKVPAGLGQTLTLWSAHAPMAYIEAEFFGGTGEQHAQVWGNGAVVLGPLHLGESEPFPAEGTPISGSRNYHRAESAIIGCLSPLGMQLLVADEMADAVTAGEMMQMPGLVIEREVLIDAPAEVVWRTITEPDQVSQWFADRVDLVIEPGARGYMEFGDQGGPVVVEAVEPPARFSFRWNHPRGAEPVAGNSMLVEFTLTPEGEDRTRLRVTESGHELMAWPDAEKQRYAGEHQEGWGEFLDRLVTLLAKRQRGREGERHQG